MGFGNRGDVSEGQAVVIFVNNVGRDLVSYQLIEDGVFLGRGGLGLHLLVRFGCSVGCVLLKLEVFKRAQSDVLLDIREVPAEIETFWLSAVVFSQVEADEARIRRHLGHFSLEVVVDVGSDQSSVREHKLTLTILKGFEVSLSALSHVLP